MCECKKMTNIRYVKIRVSWVVDSSHHQKNDWKSPKKIDQIDVSFEGAPKAIIILKCRCGLEENVMIKTMFNVKGVLLERPQKYYKIWGFFFKRYSSQMNNTYPWIEMTMLNLKGVLLERRQRYWGELEGSVGRRTSITITNVIYNGSKLRNFLFEAALNKRSLAEQETPQRCSIKISSNHLQRPLTPSDQALWSH